jgi:mycothiol synthase
MQTDVDRTPREADAIRLGPDGLVLRAFTDADPPAFTEIFNAEAAADGIEERVSEEGMRNWVSFPDEHFAAGDDVVVAVMDGNPVAYGWTSWVDTSDGLREHRVNGHVHPVWRRRRIGTAVLTHNEERARRVAAKHSTERPRVFGSWADEKRRGATALLEGAGYEAVRRFYDMVRPDLESIVVPPMPDGIEVRPVEGRTAMRQLFDADVEAFADHWGGFSSSDASFEQWLAEPDLDPSLFVVAWEGDEIAGAVVNIINRKENEALNRRRGLLDSVFVRRPWRRRGLAAALVARSLVALRARGMTSAWLGVDATNPNGAVGVYERAGFVVDLRSTGYRKPMEVSR